MAAVGPTPYQRREIERLIAKNVTHDGQPLAELDWDSLDRLTINKTLLRVKDAWVKERDARVRALRRSIYRTGDGVSGMKTEFGRLEEK